MRLRFHDKCMVDFAELVRSYPQHEFASPRRSTVPLLAFWANPESRFRELAAFTGLDPSESVQFCFEFPVPVQQGKGKASFTDLMIRSSSFAVAIEGKYTEPAYEKVKEWLSKPGKENRKAVLNRWLSLIEEATGVRLGIPQIAEEPYQLIHRTASACYARQVKRRWVIYQVFSKSVPCYYFEHLSSLHSLLSGQSCLSLGVLLSPFKGSREYSKIDERWERGERNLSKEVRDGLSPATLFEFNDVRFVCVDQKAPAHVRHEEPSCDRLRVREVA